MQWRGRNIDTLGDLLDAVSGISYAEEAVEFMALYSAENEYAAENIGYIARYFGRDRAQRIFALFGVSHPFFGLLEPTPEQAREIGRRVKVEHGLEDEMRARVSRLQGPERDKTQPKRLIEP